MHVSDSHTLGHSGSVTSVSWSEDSQWLMTCSTDKTACVWPSGRKDPVLVINTVKHNFIGDQEKDKASWKLCTLYKNNTIL